MLALPRVPLSAHLGVTLTAFMLSVGLLSAGAAAQGSTDVSAAQTECDAITSQKADVTLSRGYRGRWRRYATSEHEESALVWLRDGRLRVAVTGVSGEDNSLEVAHCFRADGSLAQVRSTLGTFYADPGPVRVERVFTYDRDGKRLHFSEQVFDTQGKRVTTDFARFALEYERLFAREEQMRAFFGAALARFVDQASAGRR